MERALLAVRPARGVTTPELFTVLLASWSTWTRCARRARLYGKIL